MRRDKPSLPITVLALVFLAVAAYFAITMTAAKYSQPERQTLVLGTSTPFPPFEMRNGDAVVGFDIDIAERIARALGCKLVIKDLAEFDALLPTLEAGGMDIAVSALTIRPDRMEVVDFSAPYYDASQGVLAAKAAAGSGKPIMPLVSKPEDFKGLRVAYQKGTTSESWVKDNLIGKIDIRSYAAFTDMNYAIQLLRFGSFDVIILDKPVAENFAKSNPDLIVTGAIETGEQYGFAVKKGDPKKLLPAVNKVIKEMKETGARQKLVEKWFGGRK